MQTALFKKTAILMEQNSIQSNLYRDILSANGFDVYVAKSAMDGLIKIKEKPQDLAIINVEIAEESFIEKLINKIRSENTAKFMPIIGLSIYNQENKRNMLKNLDAFLTKPISIDRFIESVFVCIEKKHNGSENSCN
ncbi:hypothetical protein FACS189449_11890 [Alphaproteobacteria bacterium]|nr:hypothetical protein FACS189449_11890 [Alphaproteobacteria bacterium]